MLKTPLTPLQSFLTVTVSFLVASVINIYPMGLAYSKLRPMALMMVLVFWLIYRPRHVGVGIAFMVGLSTDLLLDTRLGQQAFAAVIMAFAVRFMGSYLRQLDLSIAWAVACGALIVFKLTLWIVQYVTQNIFIFDSVYALLVSMVAWPIVYLVLIRFSK